MKVLMTEVPTTENSGEPRVMMPMTLPRFLMNQLAAIMKPESWKHMAVQRTTKMDTAYSA